MDDMQQIRETLMNVIGEEGCGASCEQADIFHDDEGWKMQLECFMGPWKLGENVDEAKSTIRELASMGFGLS